jgi:dihydroorotate dehydrogenase (fumarate)
VGVGGVESGQDAFELILCGATAVQVGTCHWKEGSQCFDRICKELEQIMASKGYKSIDDFKGKLKEWSKEGADIARIAAKTNQTQDILKSTVHGKNPNETTQFLVAVLAAFIAILLADKFTNGAFLPF